MRILFMGLCIALASSAWAQDEGDPEVPPGEAGGEAPAGEAGGEAPAGEAGGEAAGQVLGYTTAPTQTKVTDGPPYEFDGETLEDVVDQIKDQTVGSMDCSAELFLDDADSDDAQVTRCKVVMHCVRRLPKWTKRDKRPAAAQKEWDRYRDLIRKHEDGHQGVSKPFFDQICKDAKGKTHKEARAIAEEAKRKADAANEEHDRKTNHGKNEAKLDGSKDPKTGNAAGFEGGGEGQAAPAEEAPPPAEEGAVE